MIKASDAEINIKSMQLGIKIRVFRKGHKNRMAALSLIFRHFLSSFYVVITDGHGFQSKH
jgi:hypothetical protein